VFSIFGSLSTVSLMKEIGVGLAVAALIDATIVRAVRAKWSWSRNSSGSPRRR
jgi:uncharacterized membrane protein YdfJ with MMPL/SSD domain